MQWTRREAIPKKQTKSTRSNSNLFSIPFIGAVIHSPETRRALKDVDNSTLFIRDAIMECAKELGFTPLNYGDDKPDYISDSLWSKIVIAQQKSYHVDYDYVIAFYWILSLPKYQSYTKSKLVREIILR